MMTDEKLLAFIEDFKQSPEWSLMTTMRENSEWHGEESVAVHTEMLMDYYKKNLWDKRTPYQRLLTMLACAFHDVGKPACSKLVIRNGVETFSAPGHEQKSARAFENYIVYRCQQNDEVAQAIMNSSQADNVRFFQIKDNTFYKIAFMIEHHLPFFIEKVEKIQRLRDSVAWALGHDEIAFFDLLECDQHGRISVDAEAKLERFYAWRKRFLEFPTRFTRRSKEDKKAFILIGASGSGKSTYADLLASKYNNIGYWSLDDLRLKFAEPHSDAWYSDIEAYRHAFAYACKNERQFQKYTDRAWNEAIASYDTVIIDNTSTTVKARRKLYDDLKRHGFTVNAVIFPITLSTLRERQTSRNDKSVPIEAVTRQWDQVQMPMIGTDCDSVIEHGF